MLKYVINRWSVVFFALLSSSSLLSRESQKLIITAGLDSRDPYEAFRESKIFVGDQEPDFVIENSDLKIFSYLDIFFFSTQALNEVDIIAATGETKVEEMVGLVGHSYYAISLGQPLNVKSDRYLGAAKLALKVSSRKSGTKTIYAARFGSGSVDWPESTAQLNRVPGVTIKDSSGARALMIARSVGHAAHKLGLVDELLKKSDNRALYLEVGTSQNEHIRLNSSTVSALEKRQALLLLGTGGIVEYHNQKDSFGKLLLSSPFNNQAHQKIMTKNASATEMNIWSLSGGEKLWSFYKALGDPRDIDSGIAKMTENSPEKSLNIVRVFSENAAAQAAKSVYVDLVLLVARDPYAQLPSREVIDLRHSSTDASEQVAPIILLSALDVNEVILSGTTLNSLSQVEVIRHSVSDKGPAAKDIKVTDFIANDTPFLPALGRPWTQKELNNGLAGLVMKNTDADVVIFEDSQKITPFSGAIAHDVGLSRLSRPGRLSIIRTNGRQLKKIAALINENKFSTKLALFGIDPKAKLVRGRSLNDNENFRVAMSEKALLEVFGFSLMGGLSDQVADRAPFIESIYGKLDNLFFLSTHKTVLSFEVGNSIEQALDRSLRLPSFKETIDASISGVSGQDLETYLKYPYGKPRHSMIFNIEYLDFGLSKNVANDAYEYHQKPESPSLPMSRGGVDTFFHLLIFSKMSLVYDAPGLISTLSNGIRFLTVAGFDKKPSKDKVTLGLDFRLPWERTVFKGKSVVFSPVWKNLYETKLSPLKFLSNNSDSKWRELKMLPRVSKLDSLLGINTNFTSLGFQFDLGGMLTADFNQKSVRDALDYGPGFNFSGKWSLFGPLELSSVMAGYYLFPLPKNEATAKAALGIEGTVWLRVARFHDFSVSLMNDFLFATMQEKPKNLIVSSIFGVTISYGKLMRIFG